MGTAIAWAFVLVLALIALWVWREVQAASRWEAKRRGREASLDEAYGDTRRAMNDAANQSWRNWTD